MTLLQIGCGMDGSDRSLMLAVDLARERSWVAATLTWVSTLRFERDRSVLAWTVTSGDSDLCIPDRLSERAHEVASLEARRAMRTTWGVRWVSIFPSIPEGERVAAKLFWDEARQECWVSWKGWRSDFSWEDFLDREDGGYSYADLVTDERLSAQGLLQR